MTTLMARNKLSNGTKKAFSRQLLQRMFFDLGLITTKNNPPCCEAA